MGKPDVRNLRGGAGNVAYGGTVNPPRNRKGEAGNPPPTGARASALPDVQRGYLLNLRVKVPSAQIPVWRRSHIRQPTGATLAAESPDVNVLRRGRKTPDQPRRLAIRRAVARANGRTAETPLQREVGRWLLRSAKGLLPLPDGQSRCGRDWEVHAAGSRRKLKAAILNSAAEKARKVCCSGRMILECQGPDL